MTGKQTVLVTGASSGIGAELARQFAALGLTVFGTSRHPESITEPLDGVTYLQLDYNDSASIQAAAAAAGPVDILINNAGVSMLGALEEVPIDDLRNLFQSNVFGPIELTTALLPGMRERGQGRVIMVGSMLGSFPIPFRSSYAATKAALRTAAEASAREVAPFGIDIVTFEPGTIATGIGDRREYHTAPDSPYAAEYETVAAATRRNEAKGVAPADCAAAIVELALRDKPKPLNALGNNAPVVFAARRVLPLSRVLELSARFHGLKPVRR